MKGYISVKSHLEKEVDELPSSSKHLYLGKKSRITAWADATSKSPQEETGMDEQNVHSEVSPAEHSSFLKQSFTKEHLFTEVNIWVVMNF